MKLTRRGGRGRRRERLFRSLWLLRLGVEVEQGGSGCEPREGEVGVDGDLETLGLDPALADGAVVV